MFIAHLPAGFLLAHTHRDLKRYAPSIMTGALLPDADLAWCYLIDGGMVHHHSYLTHRPLVWLALMGLALCMYRRRFGLALAALALGCVLHVALDSVAGAIAWGWPLTSMTHSLVTVPATHDWWVLSFLTHWTFALEGMICLCASMLWCHQRCTRRAPYNPPS